MSKSQNFHQSFREDKIAPPSARATGLVFAAAALIVAVLWRANPYVLTPALVASALFAGTALALPRLLEPLNRAWFALAMLLNRVVSPIVMGLLFAIAIVPAGLIMQLVRDPLRAKRRPDAKTYWLKPGGDAPSGSSMTNQF